LRVLHLYTNPSNRAPNVFLGLPVRVPLCQENIRIILTQF
ncbi:hypothetical protein T4C_1488, partial [Trichinella pseudospiralis]